MKRLIVPQHSNVPDDYTKPPICIIMKRLIVPQHSNVPDDYTKPLIWVISNSLGLDAKRHVVPHELRVR